MKDNIVILNKNYISAKQAVSLSGYSSDYIGQLCRAKKLDSKIIGRTWFVCSDSLNAYIKTLTGQVLPEILKVSNDKPIVTDLFDQVISNNVVVETPSIKLDEQVMENNLKDNLVNNNAKKVSNNVGNNSFKFYKINFALTILFFVLINLSKIGYFYANDFYNNNFDDVTVQSLKETFFETYDIALNNFENKIKNYNLASIASGVESVVPKIISKKEIVESQVDELFSDDVSVKVNDDSTKVTITPIFKNSVSADYVFQLTPIENKKVESNSNNKSHVKFN